jgi:hypothetical protein
MLIEHKIFNKIVLKLMPPYFRLFESFESYGRVFDIKWLNSQFLTIIKFAILSLQRFSTFFKANLFVTD